MIEKREELAPCGVFCGACPSFDKSCRGCASENRNQERKSKWGCKIRNCCYVKKEIAHCAFCEEFPCELVDKKLLDSHPGETKFKYRHELTSSAEKIKKLGAEKFIETQRARWTCPDCGERVHFYHYECSNCEKEIFP